MVTRLLAIVTALLVASIGPVGGPPAAAFDLDTSVAPDSSSTVPVDLLPPGQVRVDLLPGTRVSPGEVVTVEVRVLSPRVPRQDVPSPGNPVGADEGPQAGRFEVVWLYLPDGSVTTMRPSPAAPRLWESFFRVDPRVGPVDLELVVEAIDWAGRSSFARVDLEVRPGAETARLDIGGS